MLTNDLTRNKSRYDKLIPPSFPNLFNHLSPPVKTKSFLEKKRSFLVCHYLTHIFN